MVESYSLTIVLLVVWLGVTWGSPIWCWKRNDDDDCDWDWEGDDDGNDVDDDEYCKRPPHHHPPRESNICQLSVWASVTLAMEIMGNHPIVSSTNTCLTFQLFLYVAVVNCNVLLVLRSCLPASPPKKTSTTSTTSRRLKHSLVDKVLGPCSSSALLCLLPSPSQQAHRCGSCSTVGRQAADLGRHPELLGLRHRHHSLQRYTSPTVTNAWIGCVHVWAFLAVFVFMCNNLY